MHCRIDSATYEEKRRAVEELVKSITVETQAVKSKKMPIVTITYRFDAPGYFDKSSLNSGVEDYTSVLVVTSVTLNGTAPAHPTP